MSVLIRGMEMPTSCGKCKLFDASHAIGLFSPLGWCRVNGKEIFRLSERADFCPSGPVPPHGRLIDADAEIRNAFIGGQYGYSWDEIEEAIDNAPTVIEAEEDRHVY